MTRSSLYALCSQCLRLHLQRQQFPWESCWAAGQVFAGRLASQAVLQRRDSHALANTAAPQANQELAEAQNKMPTQIGWEWSSESKARLPPPSASPAAAAPQQRQHRRCYAPPTPSRKPWEETGATDAPGLRKTRPQHLHGKEQAPSSSWPDETERRSFPVRSSTGHKPGTPAPSSHRGRSVQAQWQGSTRQRTSDYKRHTLQAGRWPGGYGGNRQQNGGAQQANTAGRTLPRPFLPRVGGIGSTMRPRLLAGDPQARARLAERAAKGIGDERGWEQDNTPRKERKGKPPRGHPDRKPRHRLNPRRFPTLSFVKWWPRLIDIHDLHQDYMDYSKLLALMYRTLGMYRRLPRAEKQELHASGLLERLRDKAEALDIHHADADTVDRILVIFRELRWHPGDGTLERLQKRQAELARLAALAQRRGVEVMQGRGFAMLRDDRLKRLAYAKRQRAA